jgi:ATP-dependent Zn protease
MSPSVRLIIELNIKHYRELLKSEIDAVKTIAQLLAEEEAKLAKLIDPPEESEG